MMEFLLRSLMFVPGHNNKLMTSAAKSEADVLLLDIEDSVQPKGNKIIARENIKKWVVEEKFNKHIIFPRINDRESGELLKDLLSLTIDGIHGFMYPKAKCGDDIYFIDKLLETIEYEKGFPVGKFQLIPLIETTSAVLKAQEICSASNRVIAIAFGCEDFISDLHGIHDSNHESLFTPRAMIAMAARACNKIPIDTVHINVHDLIDLEKNLITAKNLGFEGMLVLHPKELILAHKYFSPTETEVTMAKKMLDLYELSKADGKGVAYTEGIFIGPPMVINANNILKKMELIQIKGVINA